VDDSYKRLPGDKKAKFRKNLLSTKKGNKRWVILITVSSFILSVLFLSISNLILQDVSNTIAFILVLSIILTGIIFDIIGVAVTAADEAPFHAMASRKYYGAKRSIKLIRNANKVSSFCNDVIGDICGIISGTASALIVVSITAGKSPAEKFIYGLLVSGIVAAFTVGGKAAGKTIAISNSNYIVYKVGVILQFICGNINSKTNFSKDNKDNKDNKVNKANKVNKENKENKRKRGN